MKGYIHSFQSLGTVDGPGVRFVTFMQGCPLRCGCCHNPDTWEFNINNTFTPEEVLEKALRFKDYFGKDGGVTISGGEPLSQAEFAKEFFSLCKQKGLSTCLDTSGSIINEQVKTLLDYTDIILLDIKYTEKDLYEKHVGCSYDKVLSFLRLANEKNIPVWLRQVVIPTLNDNENNIKELNLLKRQYPCVKKIELLPFKKICQTKYDNLGIPFPFKDFETPSPNKIKELEQM